MDLEGLRRKIDSLDSKIVKLLNERAKVVQKIGKIKKRNDEPVYVPGRETAVYEKIKSHNNGPLSDKCLVAVYRALIGGSRALEKTLKVSYLGPKGTYSYLAAKQRFGDDAGYHHCETIDTVFKDVANGRVDFGIVPVENSTLGKISETVNLFTKHNVKICNEMELPIHLSLMAKCRHNQIKLICSKLEVIAQCEQWLAKNFTNIERKDVGSTTEAARIAKQGNGAAAIAHSEVAQLYGLNILEENIEDNPDNTTRFFVLSDKSYGPSGHDKTTIMCYIRNEPGALYEILVPFKKHAINLSKIETLPTEKGAWDYCFYLDFEGHADEDNVKEALRQVRRKCVDMKVLGSYPKSEL